MNSLPYHPLPHSAVRLINSKEVWQDDVAVDRSEMRSNELEGLIPVTEEDDLAYIVDCPSLHIVDERALGISHLNRGRQNELITFDAIRTCPQCTGAFSKARKIPIQPRLQNSRNQYPQRQWSPSMPSQPASPPPPFSSQTNLPGSVAVIAPHELPLVQMTPQSSSPPPFPEAPFPHREPFPQEQRLPARSERPTLARAAHTQNTLSVSTMSDTISLSESAKSSQTVAGRFSFPWGRQSKAHKKPPTKKSSTAPLPDSTQFCFSNCAKHLLVWRRNGDSIVRICVNGSESRILSLSDCIPNGEVDRSVSINLVAEGDRRVSVIFLNKQRSSLAVLDYLGAQLILKHLPPGAKPIALAMSRDNSCVAVGYGSFVQVFCIHQSEILWTTELHIKEFQVADEARFQFISFSPDCKYLTVVTQKYDKHRGKEDNGVWTRVWMVKEVATEGTLYGFCFMPTDHLGVTSAFFDPQVNKTFITGFIDTPYPLFHGTSQDSIQRWGLRKTEPFMPELLPTSASKPVSYKVRCASQSPHPSHASFLTATNKLYRVDVKTESVELLCDLSHQRARLGPREEAAALGMSSQGVIYMAWKEGAKIHLLEIDSAGRQTQKTDLRQMYEMAIENMF